MGSYFPTQENMHDPVANPIGDGTAWPVTWKRVDGTTTADQISQFEWVTKEITFRAKGTITATVRDHTGGGNPDEVHAIPFDHSILQTKSGTTWDVNEPTGDYVSGGQSWAATDNTYTISFSTAWGGSEASVIYSFNIGDLFGVKGTQDGNGNCTDYVKTISAFLNISVGPYNGGTQSDDAMAVALNKNEPGLPFIPLTVDQGPSMSFHAAPHAWSAIDPSSISISLVLDIFSIVVTNKFTQPADIA